jgi:hypothetical protein
MAEPQAPVLIKPLPPFAFYEGRQLGPIDLNEYIVTPDEESGAVKFYASMYNDGEDMPSRIICSEDGLFGGIPAEGTKGNYRIMIFAQNRSIDSLIVETEFTISEIPAAEDPAMFANVKSQVWEALGNNQPASALSEALARPITAAEVYYLMQRFGSMTIWDVYNLETPGPKTVLNLPDISAHYNIYDRGCCIVGAPKSLFSYERTLNDAIQTAKVMAREVYKRGWTIEFGGFNKMVRAAWIELQVLQSKFNKPIEIMHYTATQKDLAIFEAQVESSRPTP